MIEPTRRSSRIIPIAVATACLLATATAAVAAYVTDYRKILLDGAKWGYIDTAGRVVIEATFDEAKEFSEGRAAVRVGKKWGYVDVAGKLAVAAEYDEVAPFSQGLAAVAIEVPQPGGEPAPRPGRQRNLRWGYIDPGGAVVVAPTYPFAGNMKCGRGLVKVGDVLGYVGRDGKVVIEPKYSMAATFSEGLAPVVVDGKWGFIDVAGKMAIEPQFKTAMADGFRCGLAAVQVEEAFGDRWGFIDRTGKMAVAAEYDYVHSFTADGLAMVRKDAKHGYVDTAGRLVVPVKYWGASPFSEGIARVEERNDETGLWGYVDTAGGVAFANKRLYAQLRNGRIVAQVYHKGEEDKRPLGSWGFYDGTGKLAIPATFEYVESFSEGLAPFATGGNHEAVKRMMDAERGKTPDEPGL